jgi:hypothetical protein
MKKTFILASLILILLAATQVVADMKVTDVDTTNSLTDINALYWDGNDTNQSGRGQLKNANPVTEEAWLEALLGFPYDEKTIIYIDRVDKGSRGLGSDVKQLIDYDPGFHWDYAVVKYGNYWIAYEDTDQDHLLTTGRFQNGISHITFFDPTPVPEPTTLLLLGFGLIGLSGIRRKFKK